MLLRPFTRATSRAIRSPVLRSLTPCYHPTLTPCSSFARTFLFRSKQPHPDDNDPILKHVPRFLRPMASRFKNAPLSHVTSFLIVHEITAIVPLFGLWWYFNKYDFVPPGLPDWLIVKGMAVIDKLIESQGVSCLNMENSARVVMQGAAAYAIVKATLPARIPLSLLLTPSFARWIFIPTTRGVGRMFRNVFGRGKTKTKVDPVATNSEHLNAPKEPVKKSPFNQKQNGKNNEEF